MQEEDYRLYHWRSADWREIDVLIEGGHRMVAVEVKSAATVVAEDLKHVKWFATGGPGKGRRVVGLVLYLGQQALTFGDGNFALPVSSVWNRIEI